MKEVPVVKTVIKEVKVPGPTRIVEKIVRVPSPPKIVTRVETKIVRVPVPCNCRGGGGGGIRGGGFRQDSFRGSGGFRGGFRGRRDR